MCFPGSFSWQSQQQPQAPGLSVDILCSPGPWGDRHHLPSQHIPLWLFCILWWDQQDRGAEETSWAWPTLVSPSTPWGTDPAKIIWLNLQAKFLDWDCSVELHEQKMPFFWRLHPTWSGWSWEKTSDEFVLDLYSPMIRGREKKKGWMRTFLLLLIPH